MTTTSDLPLAGELTVRQLGEMLRRCGGPDVRVRPGPDGSWVASADGIRASAPDLQDAITALLIAISLAGEAPHG